METMGVLGKEKLQGIVKTTKYLKLFFGLFEVIEERGGRGWLIYNQFWKKDPCIIDSVI